MYRKAKFKESMTGIPGSSEKEFGKLRHAIITRLRSVAPCFSSTPHAANLILSPIGPDHVEELTRLLPKRIILTEIVQALKEAQ